MTNILFRVDADPTIGLGHLQRCISLAQALESIDVESVFLAYDYLEAITRIQRFGFEVCELTISDLWKEQDSAFTVDLAFESECDAIVVDSYMANSEYISRVSNNDLVTCVIDDTAGYSYPCQVVVNGNLNAKDLSYLPTPMDTLFLLGPQYLMLREEFSDKSNFVVRPTVHNILVVLGGSDSLELMPDILSMLDDMQDDFVINAIIGPFANNENNVRQVIDKSRHVINLFHSPDAIQELMMQADLAISAGGQTLYELLCVGCPTVPIEVARNQKKQLESLVELGYLHTICDGADNSVISTLADSVHLLLSDYQLRSNMSSVGQQLFDGQGALRVANLLKSAIRESST